MKKDKSNRQSEAGTELAKWRQAFQKKAVAALPCPEPEQVIGSALHELAEPEQSRVQEHLLNCRDCLELFLDVRSARAQSEAPEDGKPEGLIEPKPPWARWLTAFGRKIVDTLQALGRPKRLVPALAAVSLIVLAVIIGREEQGNLLPPPRPAVQKQLELQAPANAPPSPAERYDAVPSREPAQVQPSLPPRTTGLRAARPQAETAASSKKKTFAAAGAPLAPMHLDVAEVPDHGATLSYRADQNGYIYLLRQDREGKIRPIYSGDLEAGRTYYYPAREPLPQPGAAATQATIFVVASPTPIINLENRLKELEQAGLDQMQLLFPQAAIKSLSLKLP